MKERNRESQYTAMWSFTAVRHEDEQFHSPLNSLITLSLDFNMLDYNTTLFYSKIVSANFSFPKKEPTVNMEVAAIERIFIRLSFRNDNANNSLILSFIPPCLLTSLPPK